MPSRSYKIYSTPVAPIIYLRKSFLVLLMRRIIQTAAMSVVCISIRGPKFSSTETSLKSLTFGSFEIGPLMKLYELDHISHEN